MRKFIMFITAVCVLFLIKLGWPRKKRLMPRFGDKWPHQGGVEWSGVNFEWSGVERSGVKWGGVEWGGVE